MNKYWNNIPFNNTYNPKNKYILFDWYPGGWNNVRMSFEVACVLAYKLNRKLAIPSNKTIYLLNKDNLSLNDFFDMDNNVVEFIDYDTVSMLEDKKTISYPFHQTLYMLENNTIPDYFNGEHIVNLHHLDNEVLYFPHNLMGNFYHAVNCLDLKSLCQYVAKNIHYKEEVFNQGEQCIKKLGDQDYYSIHIRRGDFTSPSWMIGVVVIDAEKILHNIQDLIPAGSKLYIATDEKNKNYFLPFREKYDVYFYEDVKSPETPEYLSGLVEQIICARGKTFIGTYVSTFSSYINRLRGYMQDIDDKRIINFSSKYIDPHIDEEKFNGLFSREYSIGWNF
jgi:hypothetical protein